MHRDSTGMRGSVKQIDEAQAPEEVDLQPNTGMPEPPFRERSPDQDDFNASLLRGMRSMREILEKRRKKS
jgi:hypothetical protein